MSATKKIEIIDFKGYLKTPTNLEEDLQYFIDANYANDTNYLRDEFMLHEDALNRPIIVLCDVNNSKSVDEEYWIILFLTKNENNNPVGLIYYSKINCQKKNIQNFQKFLYDIFGTNLEIFENFFDFNSNDFISSLSNIKHIHKLAFDFNKVKQNKLAFNHKYVLKLDILIIEKFFGKDSQIRITFPKVLEKIIVSFKRICSNVKTFRLGNVKKLTDLLNKINFAPKPLDKRDLRIEILKIIKKLVENGQKIEEDSNINRFFENNKNHYIESMKFYRDNWLKNEKTVRNIDNFNIAAEYRLEYLVLMGKLAKNELKFYYLDQFINIFVPIEDLNKHRDELLVKFTPRDVEIIMNHEKAIWKVCDKLKFNDLLELLGDKVKPHVNYKFHENTFKKAILSTAKSINNQKSSLLIIKLILMHLKSQDRKLDNEVASVLKKLLENIPKNDENLIDHCERIINDPKQDTDLTKILVNYLVEVLTNNENDALRKRVFEILNKNEKLLAAESKTIFENELLITKKIWNYENIFQQIKNSSKINVSFFKELDFRQAKTKEIISQINEKNLQKIPKSFVEKYLQYISCYSKNEHLIEIASVLIKSRYVTLADILVLLNNENIQKENILNLIHIAHNYGEKIPKEILDRLECIENKSIFIKNLIHLIANKNFPLAKEDLVSKKSINDIYEEFEIKLVYENDLTKRVQYFDDLMLSLKKTNEKVNINATNILKSLFNSSVDITKLNDFMSRIKFYDRSIYLSLILHKIKNISEIDDIKYCLTILEQMLNSNNDYSKEDILSFLSKYSLVVDNEEIKMKVNSIVEKESTPILHKTDKQYLDDFLIELEIIIKNHQSVPFETVKKLASFNDISHAVEKGFSKNLVTKLIETINDRLELLSLNGIISIIIQALLTHKHDVPTKVIKETWNILKMNKDEERLVALIKGLSACEIFNDELGQKAIECFKDENAVNVLRIVSLQFIINTLPKINEKDSLLKYLQDLSKSKDFNSLSQLAFCSLKRFGSIDNFESDFLENYSNMLGSRGMDELWKIFVENKCQKSKYLFLYYFTNSLMKNHPIDLSIFSKQSESEWEKEILCNEIVFNGITNQILNEFELIKFRENISQLEKALAGSNEYSIEKVLDLLVLKQIIYGLTFSQINDLLSILNFDNIFIKQIFNDFKSFFTNDSWIQLSLKNMKVSWNDKKELSRFNEKLKVYNIATIINLFRKIETLTEKSLKDFLNLLETLENSVLSIGEIEEFLNFRVGNCVTLGGIKRKFESIYFEFVVEKSLSNLNITNNELLISFQSKLKKLYDSKWSLISLIKILKTITNEERLYLIYCCMEIVHEYGLRENDTDIKGESLLDNLLNGTIKNLEAVIHAQAIFNSFKGSYRKSFDELLDELITINDKKFENFIKKKIKNIYNDVIEKSNKVEKMRKGEISEWCDKIKENPVSQNEMIAVVIKGVELTTDFKIREIQLLSLLIMLETNEKGRIAQINTGEGKTTIIAMLAVIKALSGKTVDIITSSPELAKHQSKQQESFFNMFGLSVSHNCNDGENNSSYNADILYGTAGNFQGDILRDEYSKMGTRNGRKFEIAIVDEVDSMLIDDRNHIVMLSSMTPGMNNLEAIYAAIWLQVINVARCIKQYDGIYYYIEAEKDPFKDDGYIDPYVNEQIAALDDNIKEIAYPIETSIEEFIRKCTENHMRKMLRDLENLPENERNIPKDYPSLKYPEYLKDVVLNIQLKKWIDSAISARFRCEKDFQYVLSDNKIIPIDVANTGVLQQSMQWTDGLHQFLQLKHGAKLIPESFASNFISNVTFFRRYEKNIYGLTGTLGSIATQKLLENVYDLDCIIIPPFKKKQHKELKEIVCNKRDDWLKSIIRSCLSKLNNKRAVLLLTKYIYEAEEIETLLRDRWKYPKEKIKAYKTSHDSDIVKEKLKPGEIIIATNIAGRGTDIIPNEPVELNGGMHVCLTFLPSNSRVELQNNGRTSRTGNKGTSQFVILQENNSSEFSVVKAERDQIEATSLKKALDEIKKVTSKDRVFEKFCELLDYIKEYFKDLENKFIKIKLMSVEERFSIWLKSVEKKIHNELMNEYMQFENNVKNDLRSNSLTKNPYYYILSGNECLLDNDYDAAIDEYTKAINLGNNFIYNGYYNRGYAYLCKCDGNYQKLDPAIKNFKKALEIINEDLEPMLHLIQTCSHSEVLSEQISHKMTLYGIQKNAIENALGIGYGKVDKEIEDLEQQKNNPELKEEQIEQIVSQIKHLKKNKYVKEKGVFRMARNKNLDIEFECLSLKESLPGEEDAKLYVDEIDEFKKNGAIGTVLICEKKPIDWTVVISLTVIGLTQIVIGGCLAVFTLGAGSTIGMGLIVEGISDIITAIFDSRNFSWKSWGIQKAIGLAVSIVCAGLSAIKDVTKTIFAGIQGVCKVTTATVKVGWKLAFKVIGKTIANKIAHNIINKLVDYGLNKTLVPILEEKIYNLIKKPIQDALEKNKNINYLFKIDLANRNFYFCNLVIQKALEILNPKNDGDAAFSKIAKGILNGIAQSKISGITEAMKIEAALSGLSELSEFVPVFIEKLEKEIIMIKEEAKKRNKSNQATRLNHEKNLSQTTNSINNEILFISNYGNDDFNISDIDLNKLNVQDEQVELKINSESLKELSDKISDKVSGKMCSILQNKIISPTSNALVDFGMKTITKNIDDSIKESIQNYQAERRIEFFQDADRNNRIGSEFKNGIEDDKAARKADEIINSVKNGAPLGLCHLGGISESVDRPIRVYDEDNNLIRVVGEHRGGQPLDIQYIESNNEIGHWIPKGESKSWQLSATEGSTGGKFDCLPDAIAKLTGQDSNTIRNNLADVMTKNKSNLANQANDIQRLEVYNRKALTIGGLKLDEKEDIKLELRSGKKGHDDIALLNKALDEKKRGGEEMGRLFIEQVELAEVEGLPLKDENNKNNYKYHHLIPNQEIEALLRNKTSQIKELRNSNSDEDKAKLDECIKDLEYHLNQSHIKDVILTKFKNGTTNELENKNMHGNLILASFDYNPRNLFHAPSNRTNDPHHKKKPELDLKDNSNSGHDTEFLPFQSTTYEESYKNYVAKKNLRTFSDLDQNKATPPMQKDSKTGAYCHPKN